MQTQIDQIQAGWNAYDNSGDKIGDIIETGGNYIVVQKGLFLPSDVYVPLSSVKAVSPADRSVTVGVAKGDIDSMNWNAPPGSATDDTRSSYDTHATTDESVTVPLREEQLEVDKTRREAGEVTVGKTVTEQTQEMDVPVTREQVEVTRRRVDRPATGNEAIIDDGETVRIPVTAEDVEVRKDARVVEEVEVSKRPVTETRRVSETVRREELDVDETGDVLTGATSKTSRTDLNDDAVSGVRRSGDEVDAVPEAGGAAAGAVGGAAVGGVVGGPPGAIVGGAVGAAGGALAGDAVDDDEEEGDPDLR